ncbi:methyltransferase domain-containing protein [Spartinivicinus poritis]|uniref:Methyltransferase domain-containing protein n=1 Tax=Spartinivicinus poritis TaxID=2994640 RepID=A0ABT5UAU4_9GAMM|nr:methyltransferase domain-containing protein [Spartinivicinus sp. A2-2]MDE1463096.1 methyltransferase domain-containing protein [Spartinivicinus sp. A2-2]
MKLLSKVMGPSTQSLINELKLSPGLVCLDVGCGGGDVSFELAKIIGPTGQVIGVDYDQIKIDLAAKEAEQQGLNNITFLTHDVYKWKPEETFDLIYLRFLLTHLKEPDALIESLYLNLKPGGVIVVEDIDFRGHFSEPHCPAMSKFVELYSKAVHNRGADPNIGPRLPTLLQKSGLSNVATKLVQPVDTEGGIKLLSYMTLESIAKPILDDKLIEAEELKKISNELYSFVCDPTTMIGGPRVFQVWGHKSISPNLQA